MFAEVIVDISNNEVDRVFDYAATAEIKRGMRVKVPFCGRQVEGYVINLKEMSDCPADKIKPVTAMLDDVPVIIDEMFRVMEFMRMRYNLRIVDALRLFIPAQMRGGRVKELTRLYAYLNPKFILETTTADTTNPKNNVGAAIGRLVAENTETNEIQPVITITDRPQNIDEFIKPSAFAQRELYDFLSQSDGEFVAALTAKFSAAALKNLTARGIVITENRKVAREPYKSLSQEDEEFKLTDSQAAAVNEITNSRKTFVLHGVTGSGKTEVYLRCIEDALKNGKTAIMLVPEISLTPQVFSRFKARFGGRVAILHSGLSAGERFDEWQRLLSGEADVAVGARSAIFAPLKNVGVIIIDEEHDNSYNSESNPRYITSEVAAFRQKQNDCALVLGSATPSVETFYKAKTGEYKLIEMPQRINKSPPPIKIVNMINEVYAGNNSLFSTELQAALSECMRQKNQAMLFINRRGYSSFVRCTACGYVARCERCDVSLVYHKDDGVLKCHYCGNRYGIPDICPECKSQHLRRGYIGTQQVEEKIKELFHAARVLRMDNDTTQSKDAHAEILGEFRDKKADILIGTQMIAKGHDFPLVTLVGIIDADISLHFSDYKSNERTFQLITQVAGRAGRADLAGSVCLQTYSPNHYAYRFAVENDYLGFYKKEINLREVTAFPPFSTILRILVLCEDAQKAAKVLKEIYDGMLEISKEHRGVFAFLSYMHSPVKRIKNQNRMQVLARVTQSFDEILKKVYNLIGKNRNKDVSVFVEINPNSLS